MNSVLTKFCVSLDRVEYFAWKYGFMTVTQSVINSDPEILGGTPVFPNTRVPIKTFLDYLKAGDSLDLFLEHFPSVQREQTIAVLELVKEMLASYANPA